MRSLPLLIGFASIALISISCSPFLAHNGPRTFQIPWPTESGEYELQNVEIKSFDRPQSLKGQIAHILVEPYEGKKGLESTKSRGRFIETTDGVMIPADYTTLIATSIYAHLERISELDSTLGLDSLSTLWPAAVGLNVNLGEGAASVNNAVYNGDLDALLMVAYSQDDLPISVNGGVIAHEHFHAIFQRLVINKIPRDEKKNGKKKKSGKSNLLDNFDFLKADPGSLKLDTRRMQMIQTADEKATDVPVTIYNQTLLRGLNEGLADFWGWLYSGDSEFITRSLSSEESRKLSSGRIPLPPMGVLKNRMHKCMEVDKSGTCLTTYISYPFGSTYSKFLWKLTVDHANAMAQQDGVVRSRSMTSVPLASRLAIARALLKALPAVANEFAKKASSDFITPEVLIEPLFNALPRVTKESCVELYRFAPASGARPSACKQYEEKAR